MAVKQGGGPYPTATRSCATSSQKPKRPTCQNDNISRSIKKPRATPTRTTTRKFPYEGYGPCGVAVIVER